MTGRELLCYLAIKYNGDFEKMFQAVKDKEPVDSDVAVEEVSKLKTKYITILDAEYPENLKRIQKPPLVLFYKGDISLINGKDTKLAVIGNRDVSEYGASCTKNLVKDLLKLKARKNTVIISGLARGVDTAAHIAALDASGKTIAVLGSGIDVVYPKMNESLYNRIINNGGLVISEYPKGVEPSKEKFPTRDRIVAGLASAVLVTDAQPQSGTMITVMYALAGGKDVLAVPTRATDDHTGCNKLIQDGAYLVSNVDDIIYLTAKKDDSSESGDK